MESSETASMTPSVHPFVNTKCVKINDKNMSNSSLIVPRKRKFIPSYGIILYTITNDGQYLYLLNERRDSISYTEYIKNALPVELIPMHINLMSKDEQKRCLKYYKNNDFLSIWEDLWTNHKNRTYRSDYERCRQAFYKNMSTYLFYFENGGQKSNAWGFPKGRKYYSENEVDCALREFEEETTIPSKLLVMAKIEPFEELYIGTDDKLYQSVYYLAYIDHIPEITIQKTPNNIRKTRISDEVSRLGLFSYNQACQRLDREKRKILEQVNHLLLFSSRKRTIRRKTA
jgi:8-oxo-dGTP pyrophosphatase MutT (NUDIX family)